MRKTRRGPWLSGLVIALIGAVWMVGQVIGGVIGMVTGILHANDALPPASSVAAAASHDRKGQVSDAAW